MGKCSLLFYSPNDPDRQTVHRRIRPTEDQFEEQQARWNLLADHLLADLKERSEYSVRTWLQGSYKFGTQIRPTQKGGEFDIDLGVYLEWSGKPEDGRYAAGDLKSLTQKSLQAYGGEDVIELISPPKDRCSRLRFKGDFHIDIPTYHLDPDRDVRALATQNNGWEGSDPKALYLWFKDMFGEYKRDKVRRQVRYVKCWAALKFRKQDERPSSILLTVLVAEATNNIADDDMAADDDALLRVLEGIVDRLENNPNIANPVDEEEILTDRLTLQGQQAFINGLRTFLTVARDALDSDSMATAADKWAEAFEHFFPMPKAEEISKAAEGKALLPVPLVVPDVAVRAVAQNNANLTWTGTNRIGPIPKKCDIYFKVTNAAALPPGAVVEWMVRNEGEEAEYINDLGHGAGAGLTAKDRSAYKGTHYMDCTVKQYGRLIGLRRIPVEISGMFAPRRNVYKRPYWRFPGRR